MLASRQRQRPASCQARGNPDRRRRTARCEQRRVGTRAGERRSIFYFSAWPAAAVKSSIGSVDDTGRMTSLRVPPASVAVSAAPVFCAGCKATGIRPWLEARGGHYVVCTSCGLVRTDPLPFETELEARAEYWSEKHHLREDKLQRQFDPVFQRMAYGKVLRKLRPYQRNGRLLEIGCAAGAFLDAAQRERWRPSGVELSKSASAYAREQRGLDVHAGTLADTNFDAESFDAVVMLDVIEHVFQPSDLVAAVHALLRPGGALLMMTPNIRSLGARTQKSAWEAYTPDDHLWLFHRGTLGSLCEHNGFRVRTSWTMDCNPMAMLRSLRSKRVTNEPRVAAPTPATDTIARRQHLLGRLRSSRFLRGTRNGINALIGPTSLGDKLYLLAERR